MEIPSIKILSDKDARSFLSERKGLLSTATSSGGTLERGRFIECFRFLCGCIRGGAKQRKFIAIDQAIFINLSLATVLFLGTVLHFMYIDMGLGSKGGSRYWQTYSAKLGTSCVTFHVGCLLLAASFPMWAYRKFSVQPAFLLHLFLPCSGFYTILWYFYRHIIK